MSIQNKHTLEYEQLKAYAAYECLFFTDQGILVDDSNQCTLPLFPSIKKLKLALHHSHFDGRYLIVKCESALTDEALSVQHHKIYPVKTLLSEVDTHLRSTLLQTYHWINWDRQSQFCGQCGTPLAQHFLKPEKQCTACNMLAFPRFSPAIMVLIHRENELLLARGPHFPEGIYSPIAGFVDIGETAEHAVHREVKEELGIEVGDLRYFTTQTWPFPDSFMIAFTAQYVSGKIHIDTNELEDARWFNVHHLPILSSTASIAWDLIDTTRQAMINKTFR